MYWQIAARYAGIGYVQVLLILGTGLLILRIASIKIDSLFKKLFYALCLGMCAWILVTAIIYTQSKTILLGSIPLFGIVWWLLDNKKVENISFSIKTTLKYGFILLAIWIWVFLLNVYCISLDGERLYLPHFDALHSIQISQHIRETGKETYLYWQNNSNIFPYHYAEIWLHAAIQAIWNTQKTWTWQNILIPLIQFTLIIGLLALFEKYKKTINGYSIVLSCGFILFNGWLNISLPYFDVHFDFTRYISMVGAVKFMVIGVVMIVYLLSNDYIKPIILLFLPIFSILTLPIVAVMVLNLWVQRPSKITFFTLLYVILWILGFYSGTNTFFSMPLQAIFPILDRHFWNMQIYFIIVSLCFYLPLLFKIKDRILLKQIILVYLTGYILFFVTYRWYDSYQFLVLFWIPYVWVYAWVLVIQSISLRIWVYGMLVLGMVQTFFYKRDFQRTAIDNAWVNELYTYLEQSQGKERGAALWYYDIRQSHIFCWKDKYYQIFTLLPQPIIADGITQKSSSDTLTAYMLQKTFLFQQKTNIIETDISSFCIKNKVKFLIYPTDSLKLDKFQSIAIERYFENKKDKLSAIVFRP